MKPITEEKIEQVIANAALESTENIAEILLENIDAYDRDLKDTGIESHSVNLALMSSAIQISTEIIKKSLIELLTD